MDLPAVSERVAEAGADIVHVDAMDSAPVVAEIARRAEAILIANNGVRDRETAVAYLEYGADAVSVGRPSDDPQILARVNRAVADWFGPS